MQLVVRDISDLVMKVVARVHQSKWIQYHDEAT